MWWRRRFSDEQAVRQVLSGRREAFGVLVERYLPLVHALAYASTGNHADAEDIAQEVFAKAYRSLDTLRDRSKFRAWVAQMTRNFCASFHRSEARHAERCAAASTGASVQPDVERQELHAVLRRELDALDPEPREILLLYYFAGLKGREIADVLGISAAAASKRLERARETLGKRLVDELHGAMDPVKPSKESSSRITAAVVAAPAPWLAAQAPAASLGAWVGAKTVAGTVAVIVGAFGAAGYALYEPSQAPRAPEAASAVAEASVAPPAAPAEVQTAPVATPAADPEPEKAAETPAFALGGPGAIFGTVIDAGGAPVAGAEVVVQAFTSPQELFNLPLNANASLRGVTDAKGYFEFTDLPVTAVEPGAMYTAGYAVQARTAAGFAEDTVGLTGYYMPQERIVLQLENAVPISGRVHDESGVPVAGAELYAYGPGQLRGGCNVWVRPLARRAQTGPDGRFRTVSLPRGRWQFLVKAEGFAPRLTEFFETGGDEADIVIDGGSLLSARAVDADTGAAVPGLRAMLVSDSCTADVLECRSDASGAFSAHLRAGKYTVLIDHPTYVLPALAITAKDGEPLSLELAVRRGATLEGRVFDRDTGQGVAGAFVRARPEGDGQWMRTGGPTDAEGRFRIEGLADGWCSVARFDARDYPASSSEEAPRVAVRSDEPAPPLELAVERAVRVAGRVVDGAGRPVPYPEIEAQTQPWLGQHIGSGGPDGRFAMDLPRAAGRFSLLVSRLQQVAPILGPMDLPPEGVDGLTLTLEPECSVAGTLVDPAGRPMPGCDIRVRPRAGDEFPDHNFPGVVTDRQGRFDARGLCPGRYYICVMTPGSNVIVDRGPGEVELRAGERKEGLRLVYDDPLGVSGRVTDAEGRPLAGAEVGIGSGGTLARTDTDGRYKVHYLGNPGEYIVMLQVAHGGYRTAHRMDALPGQADVDFVLEPAQASGPERLRVRVARADTGEPLTQFEVWQNTYAHPRREWFNRTTFTPVSSPDGRYESAFEAGPAGSVVVRAPGFAPAIEPVAWTDGQDVVEVTLRMQPGAVVTGVVRDARGNPVAGAVVTAAEAPKMSVDGNGRWSTLRGGVRTGADGAFRLDTLRAEDVSVSAVHPELGPGWVAVEPDPAQPRHAEIRLGGRGTLTGVLAANGAPTAAEFLYGTVAYGGPEGGTVEIHTHTGADGRYRVPGLPAGEAELTLRVGYRSAQGYVHQEQVRTVAIGDGRETVADLALARGDAALEGTVTDAEGRPQARLLVLRVAKAGEESAQFGTSSDPETGQYRFEKLPAGTATMEAQNVSPEEDGPVLATADVELAPGETAQQDVRVP